MEKLKYVIVTDEVMELLKEEKYDEIMAMMTYGDEKKNEA